MAQACFGLVLTMLSRLECCGRVRSIASARPSGHWRCWATPRKKRCAVDVITQSPSKSACAVGNVIRKTRCALDVRSGQDKFKAAIGDGRATSCKSKKKQRQQQIRSCHTPCHAMSYHVMRCHAMPCRAIPCNAVLCHAMLDHAMSWHGRP